MKIAVTRIIQELRIEIAFGFLPGDDVVGVLLILVLIDGGRIECAFAERRIGRSIRVRGTIRIEAGVRRVERTAAKAARVAGLPRIVGNLVTGLGETRKRDHPRRWIKHRGRVAEEPALLRVIVNGVEGRYGILKAEAGAQIA